MEAARSSEMVVFYWNITEYHNPEALNLKVKVKVVPLLKHYAMKTYGGVEVKCNLFLNLALEVSDQLHALATLPMVKDPALPVPIL
jgi:hypothetical protein